jgi:hypothetical protein
VLASSLTVVTEDLIKFEWIVAESQRNAQITAIEVAGGTVEETQGVFVPSKEDAAEYAAAGFEPLTIIVAAASVVFVAQAVAKMWRDRRTQGGVVLDARGKKLRIRPVPNLPTGRLVVIDDSGSKVVDREEENVGRALLGDVLKTFVGKN